MAAPAAMTVGQMILASAGQTAATRATNYALDKIEGIPSPGEAQLDYLNTVAPGTSPFERLGSPAASGQVAIAKEQRKNERVIAGSQQATQLTSARIAADANIQGQDKQTRASIIVAGFQAGIKDPATLHALADYGVAGTPLQSKVPPLFTDRQLDIQAGQLRVAEGQLSVAQKRQEIDEVTAHVNNLVNMSGGQGFGRLVESLYQIVGNGTSAPAGASQKVRDAIAQYLNAGGSSGTSAPSADAGGRSSLSGFYEGMAKVALGVLGLGAAAGVGMKLAGVFREYFKAKTELHTSRRHQSAAERDRRQNDAEFRNKRGSRGSRGSRGGAHIGAGAVLGGQNLHTPGGGDVRYLW